METRQYYSDLSPDELCRCRYCTAYMKGVRAAFPEVAEWLDGLGVDIGKPFEVLPLYEEDSTVVCSGAQYVVLGSKEEFKGRSDETVSVFVTEDHPPVDIADEHYVIELQFNGLFRSSINEKEDQRPEYTGRTR